VGLVLRLDESVIEPPFASEVTQASKDAVRRLLVQDALPLLVDIPSRTNWPRPRSV
jgi:hypothetical protein